MKKILLATTAIVGAACAFTPASAQQVTGAQPFTVTIGGFLNGHMVYINGDDQGAAKKVRFLNDSELLFTMSAKADNGLMYGFRIELETIQGDATNVDEANMWVQGGWGRFEFGNEDSFADKFFGYMPLAWNQPTGYGTYPDTGFWTSMVGFSNGQLEGLTQKPFDSSDATKVSYATPVMGGFQAGISYAPQGTSDTGTTPTRFSDTIAATAVTGGMLTRNAYENFIEAGATYSVTLGSVGLRFGGTYVHADAKDALAGISYEDVSAWGLGGVMSVAGFSLGASLISEGESRLQKTGRVYSDDAWGWNITAQYAIGPWAIGGYWAQSKMEGASSLGTTTVRGVATNNRGDDELRMLGAGVAYTVAPGLSLHFAIVDYEQKDEGRTANDGQAYVLTTRVAF